jgi:hypothetical protein
MSTHAPSEKDDEHQVVLSEAYVDAYYCTIEHIIHIDNAYLCSCLRLKYMPIFCWSACSMIVNDDETCKGKIGQTNVSVT